MPLLRIVILFLFLSWQMLNAQPVADFSANPVKGCAPLKVDFANLSSGAVSYIWYFGNGNISTLKNPSAVYNNPGKYSVKLVVVSASGLRDSLSVSAMIEVFKSPDAKFTQDRKTICAGEQIQFEDKSIQGDGPITRFDWDFGDGGTAKTTKPKHIFNTAGLYHVTLTVKDTNGCESMVKVQNLILVNPSPDVSFTEDKTSSCKAPLTVEFDATVTGKYPLSYEWKFGDGNTSSSEDVTYTYTSQGKFDVSFAVTDGNKCTRTVTKKDLISIKPPVVDFSVSQRQICPGSKVKFTPAVNPVSSSGTYEWDFGNGETSYDKTPEVIFNAPGKYKITLTYDWDGCKTTVFKTDYIEVFEAPKVKLTPRDTAVCRAKKGFYSATCQSAGAAKYSWWLNDLPKTASGPSMPVPLAANATYKIKVIPLSSKGCPGAPDSGFVTVRGPLALISAKPIEGCIPLNVSARYVGVSVAPIRSYQWKLPTTPPSVSSGSTAAFVYTKLGVDTIRLYVTDDNGCKHDTFTPVMAGIKVNLNFTTDVTQICRNQPFNVRNLSTPRSSDTVKFVYNWTGSNSKPVGDTLVDETRNIIRFKLMSKPVSWDTLNVIGNSYGCISVLDKNKRPIVKVVGPYLQASVKFNCESDELDGINNSSNFTKSYWRWENETGKTDTTWKRSLKRLISQTDKLKIFVFDASTGCSDSMFFGLKTNPNAVGFTLSYDCDTKKLKAKNNYPSTSDGSIFNWEFKNLKTGVMVKMTSFDAELVTNSAGKYQIQLRVSSPEYDCDKLASTYFTVYPDKEKATVTTDRTSCFPVELTMKDPQFKIWKEARWTVDGQINIKDSLATIKYSHIGRDKLFAVNLSRIDSNNCVTNDLFEFEIGGWDVYSNVFAEPINCNLAVLKVGSYLYKADPALSFTYEWKLLNRTLNKKDDTVHIKNAQKVPFFLKVTDNKGCVNIDSGTVNVKVGYPKARFTVSDSSATCPPLNVKFTDLSEGNGMAIVRRRWDFGDNTGSALTNPGKIYIYPGKFKVRLIVTNSEGCSDTSEIPDLVVVKGPLGSFSLDRKEGCTPLPVNLFTSIGGNVAKYEFDMGDGNVLDTSGKLHHYIRTGTYIPRLILTDTLGCRFSPQPKDTIRVYATPVAVFQPPVVCKGVLTSIPSLSYAPGDKIAYNHWWLNGQHYATADSAKLALLSGRFNRLELKSVTDKGCRDSVVKPLTMFGIAPLISSDQDYYCLGEKILLTDATTADTTFTEKKMWFNGVEMPYQSGFNTSASDRGALPVRYFFKDAAGCVLDTTSRIWVRVGDTLPPPHNSIYRTTVLDDFRTATSFTPSQEPDFKQYKLMLWLDNQWRVKATSGNRNDTDLVVKALNTLQKSYCHIVNTENFCGKTPGTALAKEHCTVETKALGDTNSARVWWSAYQGWDVRLYRIYRKKREASQFLLLDSVPGNQLNYLDRSTFCHVIYDYKIEALEADGNRQSSFSDSAMAIPIHSVPVPAPEVWRTTVDTNSYTRTEWLMPNKPVYPVAYFTLYRNANNGWETYRDSLSASMLWHNDLNTRVQERSYEYVLTATDICRTVSPKSNPGLSILLNVTAGSDHNQYPELRWNQYRKWNEDVARYEVQRSVLGSDFQKIGETSPAETVYTDKTIPLHCVKDIRYRVIAVRNQPDRADSVHYAVSVSNYAVFAPEIRFFIPNAFTPDENNLNEVFAPKGVYYFSYHMKIYDRWGKKVYDGEACNNSWNGLLDGKPAPDGVYAYRIEAVDMKGKLYNFNGTIHLLR